MSPAVAVPPDHLTRYRASARHIARAVRSGWTTSSPANVKTLVDEVQCALAQHANQELRQVLFQLMAQVELGTARARHDPRRAFSPRELARMHDALERATRIVDVYLDRNQAAKLVIPLDLSTFDLGAALGQTLKQNDFRRSGRAVELDLPPCLITADHDRLMDVLAHLVTRLHLFAHEGARLRVRLKPGRDDATGFLGLAPSTIAPHDLLAEFDRPLDMDDMHLDIPYCRAVIERHGGALYVAAGHDGANGFGFTLPRSGPAPEDAT